MGGGNCLLLARVFKMPGIMEVLSTHTNFFEPNNSILHLSVLMISKSLVFGFDTETAGAVGMYS